jgi:glutathione synthase/RimK-type ligase-like ATP-grasp enzyme
LILLITNKEDITTDFIVKKLDNSNHLYYRLNTEDIGNGVDISFSIPGEHEILIKDRIKEKNYSLSQFGSVYYRRPELPKKNLGILSPHEARFVKSEFYYFIEGIYCQLEESFWISSIHSIRRAENKLHQLKVANKLGFTIPETLITTEPNIATDFIRKLEYFTVIKAINVGFIDDPTEPRIIFTSGFGKNELEFINEVSYCPTLFQKRIKKRSDLRITVVGKKCFSASISTNEESSSIIDWRKEDHSKLIYKEYGLQASISKMCVKLVEELGLQFGAIDLVEDEEGRFFFLEINPNGQWAWIEKRLNLDISGAIVSLLEEKDVR